MFLHAALSPSLSTRFWGMVKIQTPKALLSLGPLDTHIFGACFPKDSASRFRAEALSCHYWEPADLRKRFPGRAWRAEGALCVCARVCTCPCVYVRVYDLKGCES